MNVDILVFLIICSKKKTKTVRGSRGCEASLELFSSPPLFYVFFKFYIAVSETFFPHEFGLSILKRFLNRLVGMFCVTNSTDG